MMLRFRLKMLKTAILTALVFVDQKPKPPTPRSLFLSYKILCVPPQQQPYLPPEYKLLHEETHCAEVTKIVRSLAGGLC